MMNLLEAEDTVKGMPDAMLVQQMQRPSGQIPSYLIASELQRRKDMRQRYQSQQQQPAGTVAQQIVSQAMQPAQPPMSPPMSPPMRPPMQAPRVSPAQMGGIVGVAPNMQRMAQGGQVKRMQTGGLTGMPGEGALMGMTIAARKMAQELGISFQEAMERLQRQAQMNMPNYNMIAPSGLGFEDERQAVADFISGAPQAMQDAAIAQGQRMDQATALRNQGSANLIGQGISAASDYLRSAQAEAEQADAAYRQMNRDFDQRVLGGISSLADSAMGAVSRTPLARYASAAAEGVSDVYREKGIPEAAAETIRATLGGIPAAAQTIAPIALPRGVAEVADATPRFFSQLFEGVPEALGFSSDSDSEASAPPASKPSPQTQGLTDATVQGKTAGGIDQLTNIVPTGVRRSTELPAPAPDLPVPPPAATEDGLDMSDIVSQQQRMAVANALMQLGSGIIGRDYGGGAARAAEAFAQGNQAAQDTLMKERVAKFRAAQDEREFNESVRQFGERIAVEAKAIDARLAESRDTSLREAFRQEMMAAGAMIEAAYTDEQKAKATENLARIVAQYKQRFGINDSSASAPVATNTAGFGIARRS